MIDINKMRRLAQAVSGWGNCNQAWLDQSEDTPAAVVGHIDEDGNTYPVATIDCDQYYAAHQSLPLAKFYAAANPSAISELLDRLEAAEKERDALRAKIEQMERQEPVRWFYVTNGEWDCYSRERPPEDAYDAGSLMALYALPGAQNVPTSLLVAIADLVTQMEIIARVGFVDTPDDKDSCAAFCVAEGTWLELMSCVESLAASLAAAPEAKPCP